MIAALCLNIVTLIRGLRERKPFQSVNKELIKLVSKLFLRIQINQKFIQGLFCLQQVLTKTLAFQRASWRTQQYSVFLNAELKTALKRSQETHQFT